MAGKSTYTHKQGCDICELIATGKSLVSICKKKGMPSYSTVMKWLNDNKSFSDMYARAREDQADYLADELIEIADDNSQDIIKGEDGKEYLNKDHILRSRLRVDTRKWIASKLKPRKYGERQHIEMDVKVSISERMAKARKRANDAK